MTMMTMVSMCLKRWAHRTHFRLDEEDDHWLVKVEYRRFLLISLMQNPLQLRLPHLCLHHGNHSEDLLAEIYWILNNQPRPLRGKEASGT